MTPNNKPIFNITIDTDWASEYAIEYTIKYFLEKNIPITVFSTHQSDFLNLVFNEIDIGLHPFFDLYSSHGNTIDKTIEYIQKIPYNINAYRTHRFITSNEIQEKMKEIGMLCSSNICTNLCDVNFFINRFNMLEIPIFMEDGGFIYQNNSLVFTNEYKKLFFSNSIKTIIIHPMHFVLNSHKWDFMRNIKSKYNRQEWIKLTKKELLKLRHSGTGIYTFLDDLFRMTSKTDFTTINNIIKQFNLK